MQFSIITLAGLLSTALAAPALVSRQAASWTIESFTRDCTDPNICKYNIFADINGVAAAQGTSTYNFNLDQNPGITACTVVNTGTPATTQSFYGVSCQQNPDFQVSWGWNYQDNFTVLTIKQVSAAQQAYFGYNNPNGAQSYPDSGPNPVSAS